MSTSRLAYRSKNAALFISGPPRLYDLKNDPSELHDLGEQEPERLAEMIEKYAEYSASKGVIDVPEDFNPVSIIAGGK